MAATTKDFLYHDTSHTQLRLAQGVPQDIPTLPSPSTNADEIMQKNTDTLFHVSSSSAEAVHLLGTASSDVTVFIDIIPAEQITSNGSRSRLKSWPSTSHSLKVKIPANAPSPIVLLQGYVIQNGAAVSLFADSSGAKAFGFVVSTP